MLALATAASTEPVGAAVAEEPLPPDEAEPEEEDDVIRAGPLAEEVVEVELEEEEELLAEAEAEALALAFELALAARFAEPPPIVETGVHCEVAPAG